MQRLHKGLCHHFKQDAGLPIRLLVHGVNEILTLDASGTITRPYEGEIFPKDLKQEYLDKPLATTEELIKWLETHTSILIRINNGKQVLNQ